MRRLLAFAGLAVAVSLAAGQPADEVKIPTRYTIPGNHRLFPQTDPKTTLTSALKAIDTGRYDYLVAHLLDPKFVDARVDERAKVFEPGADADLRAVRQRQQSDPALDKREQLPSDAHEFAERVKQEARVRAFRQVTRDVQDKLAEDPTLLRELRRFLREGDFAAEGNAAAARLKDLKDRQVYFVKGADRWFVENRQQPEEKAADKQPAEKPADKEK